MVWTMIALHSSSATGSVGKPLIPSPYKGNVIKLRLNYKQDGYYPLLGGAGVGGYFIV